MSGKLIGAFLFAAVLSGCAAPKHNYMPQTTDVSEPPIGIVVERQVGDEMLHQGRYREHDALHVLVALKPVWAYTIMPGYFLKTGSDDNGDFYRIGGAGDESGYVQKAALADPFTALLVKSDSSLCVITMIHAAACGKVDGGFEKVKRPITSVDSVQRTLIYNGRVGEKVNIGYREFSGSTARPAFNNNVEYDLAESREIAYRGAKLEIIEATNRSIRFRVLSNFNQANR